MKTYESRHADAISYHTAAMAHVKITPCPTEQKYPPGTRVVIVKHARHGGETWHNGSYATVKYTHAHAFHGSDVDSYCLDIDGIGEVSWYDVGHLAKIEETEP